jgi:hypothetical protein
MAAQIGRYSGHHTELEQEGFMRVIRGFVLTLAICALGITTASAQGLTGKFGAAPMVGASMPIQYLQSDEGGGYATLGFSVGATGEYFINEDISVGAKFMFDRFGTDFPSDMSGNWTMMEFGVFGRYQFMPGQPTRPYARAGLLFGSAKLKTENGVETEGKIGMAPGAELAGGVVHKLQDNVSLFGEIGWTALATDGKDIDFKVDGEDFGTGEAEYHLQWVGIKFGAIFFFGGAAQ